MNLLVVGINHRSAPIEIREIVALTKEENGNFLAKLKNEFFCECIVVATCNRTEIYGITQKEDQGHLQIIDSLFQYKSCSGIDHKFFYHYRDMEAVRHLFSVASGTDSMITGDVQIAGQLKEAFKEAEQSDTCGHFMKRLFQAACHVGKRSRSETHISEGTVSVSHAAVELLRDYVSDLTNRTALIIGAGKTGRLTAKHLTAQSIGHLYVSNRTISKAEAIVNEVGGTVVQSDELHSLLEKVDIIVTSVETQYHVIDAESLNRVMVLRKGRPLYIVDIGVPRNVAPDASLIKGIHLWDMNALSEIVKRNRNNRLSEVDRVERIIDAECKEFDAWYQSKRFGPTIHDLNHFFEEIRNNEVEKHLHRFDESEKKLVHLITRRIVNKLLHKPMVNLKGEAVPDMQVQHERSLRKLFELNEFSGN
jgi:glutamyl-tRNA reductase